MEAADRWRDRVQEGSGQLGRYGESAIRTRRVFAPNHERTASAALGPTCYNTGRATVPWTIAAFFGELPRISTRSPMRMAKRVCRSRGRTAALECFFNFWGTPTMTPLLGVIFETKPTETIWPPTRLYSPRTHREWPPCTATR